MADDSPEPSFRQAAAAYRSAGQLRHAGPASQVVRLIEQPAALPSPIAAEDGAAPAASVPSPGSAASNATNPASGVSLMITHTQKEGLRRLGLSEAEIRNMTPAEAHRRLGLSG